MADGEPIDTGTVTETTTAAPTPAADPAPAAPAGDDAPADTSILGGDDAPPADGKPADPPADPAAAAPEKYELTAPEGMTLDADVVALADPVFRELGLSNEQANKLMPVAGEFAKRAGAAAIAQHEIDKASSFTTMKREWAEQARADTEIGGADFDKTVEMSAKALDSLGFPKGSPLRSYLTETGLGNHPEMIRLMRRIGERVGEDTFVRGGTTDAGKPKSDAELFYPGMAK